MNLTTYLYLVPKIKNVRISSLIYPYTFMSCARTTFIYTGQSFVLRVTHQVFRQKGNTPAAIGEYIDYIEPHSQMDVTVKRKVLHLGEGKSPPSRPLQDSEIPPS